MRKLFLGFATISLLCSCGRMLINKMLKNPQVENDQTILQWLADNKFPTQNAYILNRDSSQFLEIQLLAPLANGYKIFNKDKQPLLYKGQSTCSGKQFHEFIDSTNVFSVGSGKSLDETMQEAHAISVSTISDADYYIVGYWAKYYMGKRGFEESLMWMKRYLDNHPEKNIQFITINTDLQESWGMVPGGKAKLKAKNIKGSTQLLLTDVPYKK